MTIDFRNHLLRESARFGAVLAGCDPSAAVPTCPDWTADDLLWHLSSVYFFWGGIVRSGVQDDAGVEAVERGKPGRPGSHDELMALYERARTHALDALEPGSDADPIWTWSSDNTLGFIRRRMAQETLVHRVDAEATAAAVTEIDATLAADGVDEALHHILGNCPPWATWTPDGPVGRLVTSDTGHDWTIRIGALSGTSPGSGRVYEAEPGLTVTEDEAASFTMTATARDLEMWLWGRPVVSEPVVDGSQDAFERLRAVVDTGV